ncbi:MAG TPA: SprT family zinc-dependent metalloprotease [Candidatus Saccharimonadales bacterium]|nr:SprT family zinc-dependent metalloprotease [Candidatus Saccharimonadales bacterium]
MSTKTVTIPDIGDVTLYKRRGNRSLRLSIGHNGEIRVSLPYWLPYAAGEQFALSKAQWIAQHRVKTETPLLEHGHAIGKAHRVYFEAGPESNKLTARVESNAVRVSYPRIYTYDDPKVQAAAHKASLRALRKESLALLPDRLRTLAGQYGFTYKSVGVKPLKSRWGSCTSEKDITLNIYLMQLPWHLIDYVLVHELTHTKVMQHGAPFWAEMEKHLPNAKSLRKQMAAYQPILKAYSPEAIL